MGGRRRRGEGRGDCTGVGPRGERRWTAGRLARRLAVGAAVLLLSACSGSPSQQIDQLASSAAAARLVAADRLSGSVPPHYTRRLLASLASEVKSGTRSLEPGSLPAPLAAQALASARDLASVIGDEQRAVETGDARGLRAAMLRAQSVAQRLQALSRRASSGGGR
jgi:hypothetical protein